MTWLLTRLLCVVMVAVQAMWQKAAIAEEAVVVARAAVVMGGYCCIKGRCCDMRLFWLLCRLCSNIID
ncbi:hypothetical protein NL676_024032 [Syzygium grande]|nr:hypothetical protein NL676_024032 [Syzygium grande]